MRQNGAFRETFYFGWDCINRSTQASYNLDIKLACSKLLSDAVIRIFEKGIKPMNIVRYQRYPQRDLSVAFSRFNNIQAELDRVFGTSFGSLVRPLGSPNRWNPAVDVYQDKDQFTVYAELPGFKKEEIEISLNGDTLTIGGERKQEASDDKGVRTERFFGKFQRNLTLPVAVTSEKVTATYQDGILKVNLAEGRRIKTEANLGLSELTNAGRGQKSPAPQPQI